MVGYAGKSGFNLSQGSEFAYLQLDKFDPADVAIEATTAHASTLLQLRHAGSAPVAVAQESLQCLARGTDWLLVLCTSTGQETLNALKALAKQDGVNRLLVVATRPKAIAQWLADEGLEGQALSVREVLTRGQESNKGRERG
jgi:hypothetical protein